MLRASVGSLTVDQAAPQPQPSAAPAPRRPRVLVAEDHPVNRKVIELILANAGVELVMVENGAQACEASARNPFELIFMDMQMPVMDGLDAARFIRAREGRGEAPRASIVFLTANAMDEHAEMSRAAGGDAHLCKPIRADELLALVGRLTQKPEVRRVA